MNCSYCKDNYYLNKSDNLCYSNEDFDYFYKCSITDITGTKCESCIDNYHYGYKNHICSLILKRKKGITTMPLNLLDIFRIVF